MELVDHHLTFVPEDPARLSWFAAWDPGDLGGLLSGVQSGTDVPFGACTTFERVDVELCVPANRGTRRSPAAAWKIPMLQAVDLLGLLPTGASASASAHAFAATIRGALGLIAQGRVLPWVSPAGYDTWRLDPLGQRELALVDALTAALPTEAHAIPAVGPHAGRGSIVDPVFAVRSLFDAVADTFLRSAAANRVGSLSLFADRQPTKAEHLRPWTQDVARVHCATSRLVLRAHPPGEVSSNDGGKGFVQSADDEWQQDWRIVFQLQSRTDPSLVVDASDLWQAPAEVMDRLGDQAEVTLLSGLEHVARLVPPLGAALNDATPVDGQLADADLDVLLDRLDDLADLDIDVRWPAELVSPRLERQLVISSKENLDAPGGSRQTVTDLGSLLNVDWNFLLEGVALTLEELMVLGEAKRAIVPLRGKWVRIERSDRDRLLAGVPDISPMEALAIALGADVELDGFAEPGEDDGDSITVRVEGAVADLASRLLDLAGSRESPEPLGLEATLRPYQRRGLAWMSDLCDLGLGGCLADDMGLGKTVQLLALHQLRGGPTLVVCPTSLLGNWKREAAKFIPGTKVHTYHGQRRELMDIKAGDLVVTTYGVVRTDAAQLAMVEWDLVVADEAQQVKNPRSRSARALRQIPGTARIALTGTPVENRLSELWSILDWAVPGLLGPLETFRRQTATPIERDNDREAALRLNRIVRPFLLRRKKTDDGIAPDLPDKIERDLVVPLSAEQVTLYKATVETALAEVSAAEGIARRGLILKLLTGLKQITNHPAQFLKEAGPLEHRSGKLDALEELLDEIRANGESTLIFTQYVKMGTLLVGHLGSLGYRIEMLHGGQSVAARQDLVDRFQNNEIDILILSLKAGGTGLNLTAATNVVHYDRWWNPAVEDQATDRAYRIGQENTVTVHRIITEGTVEDRVAELLRVKRKLADRVIGTGDSWIGDLTDDDLTTLVALGAP